MRSKMQTDMLRECEDVDSFLRGSDDRFVRCVDLVAWYRAPDLLGIDVWGDGSPTNLARRAYILDHFAAPGRRRLRLLFDSSTCRDASPTMYRAAFEFWSSRREQHAAAFDKVAAIVSSGYVGALITGLTVLMDPGYSMRTFQTLEAALAWLGEADTNEFAVRLRDLRSAASHDDAVGRLQQLLAERDLSMEGTEAAHQLGMSLRTLQRRLSTARTTFQAESLRAKLVRATTLMLTGKHTIAAIAFDLGFASPQHFSSRFSAVYGQPPSIWLRNYHAAMGAR